MSDLPPTPAERDDDLAVTAEFVLGLLEPAELAAFEQRLNVDPGFRALVAAWSEDFAGLFEGVPPVTPPPHVEAALMRRLFPEERQSLWRRLGILPALLGGLAAALLVLWTTNLGLVRPQDPDYAATVAAADGSLVVLALFEPGAEAIAFVRQSGAAPEGRVLEMWLIPEGGTGTPIALGLLSEDDDSTRLEVPEAIRPAVASGLLAITDEPPGGAPDGVPTGTVLASGPVTAL